MHSEWMKEISQAVQQAGIYVVLGANEPINRGKGHGTIYNTIYTFDRSGTIVNHHRKLMPTYTEKLVHGLGDAAGLQSVDTDFGMLGSLICWEHWMPLTRQTMHDKGEDIHIALWPYVKEMHQIASRHYAHEGRTFVIAVGQVMSKDEIPEDLTVSSKVSLDKDNLVLKGGSAIYGPDGAIIQEPIYGSKEFIIAEIDTQKTLGERMNLSVSGHYRRNDVFHFTVDHKRDS